MRPRAVSRAARFARRERIADWTADDGDVAAVEVWFEGWPVAGRHMAVEASADGGFLR